MAEKNYTTTKLSFLNIQSLLWLALALALAGSLKHLAGVFASIDGNHMLGWLQAIAIDSGLFALAYSIRQRKSDKRSVKPLWFGVSLFSLISIYGNLAYALAADGGNLPGWISATKPYLLAASLPVLVLFLSELLSDDRQYRQDEAEKEARRAAKKVAKKGGKSVQVELLPDGLDTLDAINTARSATKDENLYRLSRLLDASPEATNTELAGQLGVSRGTIRNYKQELAGNGNGNGAKQ